MSHYTTIDTDMTDPECIKKALNDMGFTNEMIVEQKARTLLGYRGKVRKDDITGEVMTADLTIEGMAGANHVGGASNDIGWRLMPNGTYQAVISENEAGRKDSVTGKQHGTYGSEWQGKMLQAYGFHKTTKLAKKKKLRVKKKEKLEGGYVKLTLKK